MCGTGGDGMRGVLERLECGIERVGFGRLYVVLALLFGGLMLLVTPPYQVPDEPMHVFRAWQVSEGVWVSPVVSEQRLLDWTFYDCFTADIPASLWRAEAVDIGRLGYSGAELQSILATPLEPEKRMSMVLPNTGGYAPLAYAPQAAAAWLGSRMGLSVGWLLYFMRFAGLAFVVSCVGLSLRLLPEKRLLVFLLGMMPMFLFQASSSADAVVNGVCVLGAAWLLSLRRESVQLTRTSCALLILLAVCLGLLKQVYGALLLLYFLLPVQRMRNRQRFWGFGVFLLAVSLGASTLWLQYGVAAHGARLSYMTGTDMAAQLAGIKAAPGAYLGIFLQSVQMHAREWWISFIGQLGWLNVALPGWFLTGYSLLIFMGAVWGALGLRFWQRLVLLLVFCVAAAATITSLYLTWTVVGAPIIDGVQGRYFIAAVLPLLAIPACRPALRYEGLIASAAGLISGVVSVQALYMFYYLR